MRVEKVLVRVSLAAFAILCPVLTSATGWQVSVAAGPGDPSRLNSRKVTAAVTDENGKSVKGLNKSSFHAMYLHCVTRECTYVDATLGYKDEIPAVQEIADGLYLLQIVSDGSSIALRVLTPINIRALVPGTQATAPTEAERQMAFVMIQ